MARPYGIDKFLMDGAATTRATVTDLVTMTPLTFTGGCTDEPSNFRTLLGAQAPVCRNAGNNRLLNDDTLTQDSIGAWGSLSNCTLEASTDEPWEGYSYCGKMTVTANGAASTTLNVTAVTTNGTGVALAAFCGTAGRTYLIRLVGDVSGATSATAITATGAWQQVVLTKTFASDTVRSMVLMTGADAQADDVCYWSACQIDTSSAAQIFHLDSVAAASLAIANPLTAGQAFTIIAAVQTPWVGNDGLAHILLGSGTYGAADSLHIFKSASNYIAVCYYDSDGNYKLRYIGTDAAKWAANTPHLVVATLSGATPTIRLDGSGTGAASAGTATVRESSLGTTLDVGKASAGASYFNGAILCTIIGRVLTDTEIAEIEADFAAGTLEWGELTSYTAELPLATVTGAGLALPDPVASASVTLPLATVTAKADPLEAYTPGTRVEIFGQDYADGNAPEKWNGGLNGDIRLDLNDGTNYCFVDIQYPPPTPKIEYRDGAHGDGREKSFSTYENREITLTINVWGTDEEDLSINVRSLWEELLRDGNTLLWKPDGWYRPLYFDLIAPAIEINTPDWFETWRRDHKQILVMSNVEIVLEAKPFARGEEETVTLLDGDGSPMIAACTGIVVPPTAFKGDVPAPADIFIDLKAGTCWTDLIFGQRDAYHPDFDPIQDLATGDTYINPALGRLNTDYWRKATATNLMAEGNFEGGFPGTWIRDEGLESDPTSVDITSVPEEVFEGAKALKISGGSDGGGFEAATYTVDPTKNYIFSFAVMGTANTLVDVAYLYRDGVFPKEWGKFYYAKAPLTYTTVTVYIQGADMPAGTDTIVIGGFKQTGGEQTAIFFDNFVLTEVDAAETIQAEFNIASHEGRYLPVASVSFDDIETFDDITINSMIAKADGTPITTSVKGATVSAVNPDTDFHEIAFLDNRFKALTVPSHRISSLADKTQFLQQIKLEFDSQATAECWYDYIGIIPIDKSYVEVRNWNGGDHLILDSRSSHLALSSLSGTIDDAMVYNAENQKGECNFVADPRGFNGAILATTNVDGDDQILSVVDITMKYSPLYLLVPEA